MESNDKGLRVSQWTAIVNSKCPRCRIGNLFNGPTYGLKGQKMNDLCPHCGLRFEREVGYFYVAMFVSYAMNCAEMISLGVATYILSGGNLEFESLWLYLTVIFSGCLILAPFNYRYSRVILLHWLSPKLKYNPYYDKP